jgi:hypothetical protein
MFDEAYLRKKIKRLSEAVWERRAQGSEIELWLSSFSQKNVKGVNEKLHMLYLLSNFLYFGVRETRELLRSLFRQLCQRPLIMKIRKDNGDTIDIDQVESLLTVAVGRTRFLAVGNPSESGHHLLYYFRQENHLSSSLFPHQLELPGFAGANVAHGETRVDRYIFIDDLCGSGQQIEEFSNLVIAPLARAHPKSEILYFPIFATTKGLDYTRAHTSFTKVECLMELDKSFMCFSDQSRFYEDALIRDEARDICERYGSILFARHPLGYRNCQLALGFNYNTPKP